MIKSITQSLAGKQISLDNLLKDMNQEQPVDIKCYGPNNELVECTVPNPIQAADIYMWFTAFWSGHEITMAFSQED